MGCLCSKERIDLNGRRFYVRELLGQGGFSTVDLVEDVANHQLYALKRITCHSTDDQRVAMSEVEYHRLLSSHHSVIEVHDFDLKEKMDPLGNRLSEVLILLPFYRRGTLSSELERREKTRTYLSENEVLRIFLLICDATLSFHTSRPPLAHRDLKTANILLTDSNDPVIMDLGSVAKARVQVTNQLEAKQLEETAAERSSMPYRAPEFFNVSSQMVIDERTDVWSLGCILYALCYFKSPFDIVYERGDSVALAVGSGRIDFPADSQFSKDLQDLIKFILVVDPNERPFLEDVITKAKQLDAKNQVDEFSSYETGELRLREEKVEDVKYYSYNPNENLMPLFPFPK